MRLTFRTITFLALAASGLVPATAAAVALALSPDDSKVFVTGPATGTGGSGEYSTMGYSTANGSRLWTVQYQQAGAGSAPVALGVSPDGSSVFVTGTSTAASGHSQFATVAYGA